MLDTTLLHARDVFDNFNDLVMSIHKDPSIWRCNLSYSQNNTKSITRSDHDFMSKESIIKIHVKYRC